MRNKALLRFLPFLQWFPISRDVLRADLIAGVTVALVLIPQSMAYAQLAGLPPYYGLYAAFLPVIFATFWSSSNQLSTGPVAMTSLLTASALASLALAGSQQYIELAILLAMMAGVIRVLLGLFRMGIIVNFIPHPVLIGFTNAAAIIISLSQLDKLLGVARTRGGSFLQETWGVFQQVGHIHLPTFFFGASAIVLILLLKKHKPKFPGVLIAVVLGTLLSYVLGFERKIVADVDNLADSQSRALAVSYFENEQRIRDIRVDIVEKTNQLMAQSGFRNEVDEETLTLNYDIKLLNLKMSNLEKENQEIKTRLLQAAFDYEPATARRQPRFSMTGASSLSDIIDMGSWRLIKIGDRELVFASGGAVIGQVPSGLPPIALPKFDWARIPQLLPSAFVLVLIGFMEAVSIAKIIAARTRQRFDVNQQLIGQGIANIVGSLSSSYPVSGSFSRSALNLSMGAKTGISSVIAGLVVMLVLLYLTPFLYHLPQAVLAAVIITAVIGLIQIEPLMVAWRARWSDGLTGILTFLATLAFAPQLEKGIYVGAGLALVLYLARRTKPRVAILGRHPDGTLRDAKVHNLRTCDYITVFRFDGSLDYPDVSYFEDMILDVVSSRPKTRFILVIGEGINHIDASGAEMLRNVHERLKEMNVQLVISGLKRQVFEVMRNSGVYMKVRRRYIFRTEEQALDYIFIHIDDPEFDPEKCPLKARRSRTETRRVPEYDFS